MTEYDSEEDGWVIDRGENTPPEVDQERCPDCGGVLHWSATHIVKCKDCGEMVYRTQR